MKIKKQNIKELEQEILAIQQEVLKFKVRFKLNKLYKEVLKVLRDTEKFRLEILNKYGTVEEGDTQYTFKDDEIANKFYVEYNNFLIEEIDLEYNFSISDFENCTGKEYNLIFDFIKEDEDEDEIDG